MHAVAPILSVALVLAVYPLAADPWDSAAQEEREWRDLPALPDRADPSVEDLELTAIALAAQLFAVPVDEAGTSCSPSRLRVSWSAPSADYEAGAHLEPVGPVPTTDTTDVNGVVLCHGSTYAYMGFEAWRDGAQWRLAAVPFVAEEHEDHGHEVAATTPGAHAVPEAAPSSSAHPAAPLASSPAPPPVRAPSVTTRPVPASGPAAVTQVPAPAPAAPRNILDLSSFGQAIDGYAAYEPQRTCSPAAKPGTAALRDQLLAQYAGSRNLGISRGCSVGGQSEHKEGRALDWGVLVSRPTEKAAGDQFVAALLATDSFGNRHALARRMGVMYVIWNRQIWSAYRPESGWRPYSGVSPHTDHVHISLSWDGAMARTSFWAGQVTLGQLQLGQITLATNAPAPGVPGAAPATPSAPATGGAGHDRSGHDHGGHDNHDDDRDGHDSPAPSREDAGDRHDHDKDKGHGHGKGHGHDKGKGKGRHDRTDDVGEVATTTGFVDQREGDAPELARAAERQLQQERRAAEQVERQMRREATTRAKERREAERLAAEAAKEAERQAAEAAKEAAKEAARAAREAAHAEEHARHDGHRHAPAPTTPTRVPEPAAPAPAPPKAPKPPKAEAPKPTKAEAPKPTKAEAPKPTKAPKPPKADTGGGNGGGNGKSDGGGKGGGKGKGGG